MRDKSTSSAWSWVGAKTVGLALGIACLAYAPVVLADGPLTYDSKLCTEGKEFRTVSYFHPTLITDLLKYQFQGGHRGSLCDLPHGRINPDAPYVCQSIDLKGYLYLPPLNESASGSPPVFRAPQVSSSDNVATADHDLPLIVYVEGSFANLADPSVPNPKPYPNECTMAKFFASHGYAFLAIVRRGYLPSTGMNEMVMGATSTKTGFAKSREMLDYLANESFEVQQAILYMRRLRSLRPGRPVIDPAKVAVMGHSLGGMVTLFYADANNLDPLFDAGTLGIPQARAKIVIAAASESWDGFDLTPDPNTEIEGSVRDALDDDSAAIRRLKASAQNSALPTYYLEPINDASSRPTVVLGKAAGDANLDAYRNCHAAVFMFPEFFGIPGLYPDAPTAINVLCAASLAGLEHQSALFPVIDIAGYNDPTDANSARNWPATASAHNPFISESDQIALWGPSAINFFSRYGVKR